MLPNPKRSWHSHKWLIGAAAAVLAGIAWLPPAIAHPGPSVPVEASAAGDGPVLAQADPFTTDASGLQPGQIEMTTVSTRPTLVSGGQARVQVRGVQPDDRLIVMTGTRNVSAAFGPGPSAPGQAGGIREGLVSGLQIGTNRLVATASDIHYGSRSVTLDVVDHSIDGPVISGPHQEPFVCGTAKAGLGTPTNGNCDAPTTFTWYAHNLLGEWVKLADPYAPPPAGTSTIDVGGRMVPFVVRVESAVINRSITRIAVLDDPSARGAARPFAASEWNRNLIYQFGESCGTGFQQSSNQATDVFGQIANFSTSDLVGPLLDLTGHLQQGWMVAQSTLTTFGVSCNPLTSAETLMMVKEHIVDGYGDVSHTIGAGASGGAIQQYLVANNYPGLVDAGTPLFSFPDILTTAMTVTDCTLLDRVFAADPNRWTMAKQNAVTGEVAPQVCQDWQGLFGPDLSPASCPSGIPAGQIYDAKTNPHGVRCDLEDDDVNGLGRDASGHALLPLDNAGVQYGLDALRSGAITPQDFVALNRAAGGFDHDGALVASRNQLTAAQAAYLYRIGEITGQGALADTPIIDQSIPVGDVVPSLDIHQQVWPYAMQSRLQAAGDSASQVIWSGVGIPSDAIDVANDWLDRIDAAQAAEPWVSRSSLVARSRPPAATNQCRLVVTGLPGLCDHGILAHGNPRQMAGGPLSMDNIDCQLAPVQASDYPASVGASDLQQIKSAFPTGVCNYSVPPVGWSAHSQTWLTYGSTTLASAPVAVPYPLARSLVPRPSSGLMPVAPLPAAPAVPLPDVTGSSSLVETARSALRLAGTVIDLLP